MNPLQPKKHFKLLDGLRGVAAIMVVFFHFMEIIITDFTKNFLAHGFLAVDFFFCLSGFVIAYAYDDRMPNLSLKQFTFHRLKRLHPLVVLGSIIGLLGFIFDPFSSAVSNYSFLQISILFLSSSLLIPYPVMEDRYFNLFGLNAPSWSLFWEYVANLVYALILVRLDKKWLLILLFPAALVIIYIVKTSGNLLGGWNGDTFWHGGGRLAFAFLSGMCIYRFNWIIENKIGFLGLSILLCLAFIAPYHPGTNIWVEPLIVLIYFPLIVSLGAGSYLNPKQEKICEFSGKISYPLYITHYFVMWPFAAYYAKNKPDSLTLIAVISAIFILVMLIAYLAANYFDKPIREKLNQYR